MFDFMLRESESEIENTHSRNIKSNINYKFYGQSLHPLNIEEFIHSVPDLRDPLLRDSPEDFWKNKGCEP